MIKILAKIKRYIKIYSTSSDVFNGGSFREKYKNYLDTIAKPKIFDPKILIGYSLMKLIYFNG